MSARDARHVALSAPSDLNLAGQSRLQGHAPVDAGRELQSRRPQPRQRAALLQQRNAPTQYEARYWRALVSAAVPLFVCVETCRSTACSNTLGVLIARRWHQPQLPANVYADTNVEALAFRTAWQRLPGSASQWLRRNPRDFVLFGGNEFNGLDPWVAGRRSTDAAPFADQAGSIASARYWAQQARSSIPNLPASSPTDHAHRPGVALGLARRQAKTALHQSHSATMAATSSASAKLAVRPGDSMPNSCTTPGHP